MSSNKSKRKCPAEEIVTPNKVNRKEKGVCFKALRHKYGYAIPDIGKY